MKFVKLFENFRESLTDDEEDYYKDYLGLDDDIENILLDIRDIGFEFKMDYHSGMSECLVVDIFRRDDSLFKVDQELYDKIIFINEYLINKYKHIFIQVSIDSGVLLHFPINNDIMLDDVHLLRLAIHFGE